MSKLLSRFMIVNFAVATILIAQSDVKLKNIQQSLICTCDCNMTVETCAGSMGCATAKKLTEETEYLIQNQLSEAQILDIFVERYGEQILAAPTKSGFNLVAWIVPFIVLGAIGFGITQLLRRWAITQPQKSRETNRKANKLNKREYEEQLDEILRRMD